MSTKNLKKAVKNVYDEVGLESGYDPDHKVVFTQATIDEGLKDVLQIAVLSKNNIVFITTFPHQATSGSLEQTCMKTMFFNCGLVLGSYDLDKTGTIRFRSTLTLDEADVSPELIKKHILHGFLSMEVYKEEIWTESHLNGSDTGEIPDESQTYQPREDCDGFNPMFI